MTSISGTQPQRAEQDIHKTGLEISYSHKMILRLPVKMQDTAWQIDQFIKNQPIPVYWIGGVLMPVSLCGILLSLPFALAGAAAGFALKKYQISPFTKLQNDDKAWIILASVVATVVTGWPLCLVCASALIFFIKQPTPKYIPPVVPKRVANPEAAKVALLVEEYKNNPEGIKDQIKEANIKLREMLHLTFKSNFEKYDYYYYKNDKFIKIFNEFACLLEAYIQIVKNNSNQTGKDCS